MMSADPYVPDPTNAQTWNRYSYVINNPLSITDPNGYCFLGLCSIGHTIGHFGHSVRLMLSTPMIGTILKIAGIALCGGGVVCAVAVTAVIDGVTSGRLSVGLRSGFVAAATAAAFFEVGEFTSGLPGAIRGPNGAHGTFELFSEGHLANIAGHALVGCGQSVASGGKCGPGALAAGVTSAAGPVINSHGFVAGLVANTVLGGLASVAGGGKFANGAVTGAFGYLFNAAAGRLAGQWAGGAIAGALGFETGPGDALVILGGRWLGGAIGSAIEDMLISPSSSSPGGGNEVVDIEGTDKQWGTKFGSHGPEFNMEMNKDGLQQYKELARTIRNDPNAVVTHFPEGGPYAGETHYQARGSLLRLDQNGMFRSLYPLK